MNNQTQQKNYNNVLPDYFHAVSDHHNTNAELIGTMAKSFDLANEKLQNILKRQNKFIAKMAKIGDCIDQFNQSMNS